MDVYNQANALLNVKKQQLKPEYSNSRRQLHREAAFWSSLYSVLWPNDGVRKEIEVIIEMELETLRKNNLILSKYDMYYQ